MMFGMSDDDDEASASEEEDFDEEDEFLGRNVVASAIKGGGCGAFASPGASKVGPMEMSSSWSMLLAFDKPPSRQFLASSRTLVPIMAFASGFGADPFADEASAASSRRLSRASPLLRPVEVTRFSSTSPLIAMLNPFGYPPSLDLPPAALGPDSDGGGREADEGDGEGAEGGEGVGAASTSCAASSQVGCDVQHLIEEMGDLMCLLQQQQELSICAQQVQPEDMLERLDHFREVAREARLTSRRS